MRGGESPPVVGLLLLAGQGTSGGGFGLGLLFVLQQIAAPYDSSLQIAGSPRPGAALAIDGSSEHRQAFYGCFVSRRAGPRLLRALSVLGCRPNFGSICS